MRKVITIVALTLSLISISNITNAQQKFGYINSEELISLMPEYQTAMKDYQTYANSFQETLDKMKKEFQAKYDDFVKNEKTLTETMKEVKTTELKSLDENLQKFQQSASEQVQEKQKKLLAPITQKAETAINEVAKANNIAYVFDMTSTGIIVAPPGDNILPLLKTKLNLKDSGTATSVPHKAPTNPKR